jgi:hypothetical protein
MKKVILIGMFSLVAMVANAQEPQADVAFPAIYLCTVPNGSDIEVVVSKQDSETLKVKVTLEGPDGDKIALGVVSISDFQEMVQAKRYSAVVGGEQVHPGVFVGAGLLTLSKSGGFYAVPGENKVLKFTECNKIDPETHPDYDDSNGAKG